jgi:hypothetical protein
VEVLVMFIRIVRPQIKPGQSKEAAKRWETFMGPRAKDNPHFKSGYMAASPDGTSIVAVTLWDELPDEATTKQVQQEIAGKMEGIMTGPPAMEEYEVIGQI